MNNCMVYKDYVGSVEFSEEDEVLFGKVQGIRSLLSYEGKDVKSLIADFHKCVDEYLEMCEDKNIFPELSYKGSFNIRISPDLHRRIALLALNNRISINKAIEEAIAAAVKDIA